MPHYMTILATPLQLTIMDDMSIHNLLERANYVQTLLLEQTRLGGVPRSARFTEGMMLTMESVGSIKALTTRFEKKSAVGKYFSWRIRIQLAELENEFESRVLLLRDIAAQEQPRMENQLDSIPRRSTASYREDDRPQEDEVDLHDRSHRLDRIGPESGMTDFETEFTDRDYLDHWVLSAPCDSKPAKPKSSQILAKVTSKQAKDDTAKSV